MNADNNETIFKASGFDHWMKYACWALPLFIAISFLLWGARPLWDSSEARYGQAAFEMLSSGNWLVPTLGGEPHLTKPPLTYWMIGLGMKLFGINAWGARFFLSVAFLATILIVRELAATMGYDGATALAASLIYATSLIPFAAGHTLTTDGFLVCWETLGILAAWKVWQGEEAHRPRWRLVFWIALALAFLTKGPPGWLSLVVIGVFLLLCRPARPARLFSPLGFGLFLVLSFWWYGLISWRHPELLRYFLYNEVYQRIFSTVHHRNLPFWIYLPVLLLGVGPWLVLWPGLFKRAWRYLPGKPGRLQDWQLFLVLWVALPLAIFTLAKSRLVFYVLPLFVPIALAMGRIMVNDLLPRLNSSVRWRQSAMVIAALWVAMCVVYTTGAGRLGHDRSLRDAAEVFRAKIAQMGDSRPCYWIWGKPPNSLAFYMQRVISSAESLRSPEDSVDVATSPFFIAKEDAFKKGKHQGELTEGGRQPRVLAISQGCVLFTMVQHLQAEDRSPTELAPAKRRGQSD